MTEEQIALAKEALKRDKARALKLEDIVTQALRNGLNPRYVAIRYGMDVERCQRYAAAWAARNDRSRRRLR